MRHFLLLFFTTTCFAQNTRVLVYRLIDGHCDGPCSVKTYVEGKVDNYLTYVSAESNDSIFAKNLLSLKKISKKWKKRNHFCESRTIGGDMTHNMFTIEYKGKRDTILTTYNNEMIVFPGTGIAYVDENQVLKKMFTGNIKEFFEHDFNKQIRALFMPENDSITSDKILYKGEPAINFISKDFKSQLSQFKHISSDSVYNEIKRKYAYTNDTIQFYKNNIDITLTSPNSNWNIDWVKPRDSEELLFQKYPTSTKIPKYNLIKYEDIKRKYFYWVELIGNKGSITYHIKDHIIEKIEINLH